MPRPQQQESASRTSREAVTLPLLLPHPAEDLSEDDDLLSWILIDQLGCLPDTRLGVHPQQVKFVGPSFKRDEVLTIIQETAVKGNLQQAIERLQEFHLIKEHLESKLTDSQRDRVIQHLRRYLLIYLPTSRLEIYSTSRYTEVTGHTELAIFATRPLAPGIVLQEIQGSVVPLPDQWREEMEIGEGFALEPEGDESDESDNDEDDASPRMGNSGDMPEDDDESSTSGVRRGKTKEQRGQRRSDRTKRRDFSIVWSGLKRCYQLFLGPARFLNHDCSPNVELLRQGKYVTFRVIRSIKVGEELTTFYGENYFGRENVECLCLTCEQNGKGGFTQGPAAVSPSRSVSAAPSVRDSRPPGPSSLRNAMRPDEEAYDSDDGSIRNNATTLFSLNATTTPQKRHPAAFSIANSPATESGRSEPNSPGEAPRRERLVREVRKLSKPLQFLQRPRKDFSQADNDSTTEVVTDDLPDDFPRCVTCAKALHEQVWAAGRYYEHCTRCIRHSMIYQLPWPAHRPQDVQEYPPAHLIPFNYIPCKISSVPLPSDIKSQKKKAIEREFVQPGFAEPSEDSISREERRAIRFRREIELEEFIVEQLREAAWQQQDTREQAIIAAAEAKESARVAREEAKRKRNEGKHRGTGVWSRYEIITADEIERRERERNQVLSGTRRGGRFRTSGEEAEMKRLAEEIVRKQSEARKRAAEKAKLWREKEKYRLLQKSRQAANVDENHTNPTQNRTQLVPTVVSALQCNNKHSDLVSDPSDGDRRIDEQCIANSSMSAERMSPKAPDLKPSPVRWWSLGLRYNSYYKQSSESAQVNVAGSSRMPNNQNSPAVPSASNLLNQSVAHEPTSSPIRGVGKAIKVVDLTKSNLMRLDPNETIDLTLDSDSESSKSSVAPALPNTLLSMATSTHSRLNADSPATGVIAVQPPNYRPHIVYPRPPPISPTNKYGSQNSFASASVSKINLDNGPSQQGSTPRQPRKRGRPRKEGPVPPVPPEPPRKRGRPKGTGHRQKLAAAGKREHSEEYCKRDPPASPNTIALSLRSPSPVLPCVLRPASNGMKAVQPFVYQGRRPPASGSSSNPEADYTPLSAPGATSWWTSFGPRWHPHNPLPVMNFTPGQSSTGNQNLQTTWPIADLRLPNAHLRRQMPQDPITTDLSGATSRDESCIEEAFPSSTGNHVTLEVDADDGRDSLELADMEIDQGYSVPDPDSEIEEESLPRHTPSQIHASRPPPRSSLLSLPHRSNPDLSKIVPSPVAALESNSAPLEPIFAPVPFHGSTSVHVSSQRTTPELSSTQGAILAPAAVPLPSSEADAGHESRIMRSAQSMLQAAVSAMANPSDITKKHKRKSDASAGSTSSNNIRKPRSFFVSRFHTPKYAIDSRTPVPKPRFYLP